MFQRFIEALDDACARSETGERKCQVFFDAGVRVSITDRGAIQVEYIAVPSRDEELWAQILLASKERSYNRQVTHRPNEDRTWIFWFSS